MITFESENEVIVTTVEKRQECIELYFNSKCDRDLDEYDEHVSNDCAISITSGYMKVD